MVKYKSQISLILFLGVFSYRESIPFFAIPPYLSLIKMQIPSMEGVSIPDIRLVWRLSEFAFFVRLLW